MVQNVSPLQNDCEFYMTTSEVSSDVVIFKKLALQRGFEREDREGR